VSAQYLRSLSFLVGAAAMVGCSSDPTRVIPANPTDGAVFAALFASHPGLGAGAAVALKPPTMGTSGPAEALPAGMEFPRTELHSTATFSGSNLVLAKQGQLASAYKSTFIDLQHWKPFQRRFPGFNSILSLSHAYVSANTAAVYVEVYCGGLCGTGDVYLFERTQTGWQFLRIIELWIS
jgi:hypothetical protein